MRATKLIAIAGFFLLVPGSLTVAYLGSSRLGLYPTPVVPIVFGGVFLVGVVGTFLILSYLSSREGEHTPTR